jgi:stringent starvation protein B
VLGNEAIEFQARFSGVTENLYIPIAAVTAIYARETGAGMGFEVEQSTGLSAQAPASSQASAAEPIKPSDASTPTPDPKKPRLTVVK